MKNLHEYVDKIKAKEAGPANCAAPAADWSRTWSSKRPSVPPARISVEKTQCSALRLSLLVQAMLGTFLEFWAFSGARARISREDADALHFVHLCSYKASHDR